MTESKQQYGARIEQRWYEFFRKHYKEGILPNQANKRLLEDFLDNALLEITPENLETALLGISHQLAVTAKPKPPEKPAPPAAEPPPPEVLSEEQELRRILRDSKGDDNAIRNQMRSRLRVADAHAAMRKPVPPEITRERILKARGDEVRNWIQHYGNEQINARLAGKE